MKCAARCIRDGATVRHPRPPPVLRALSTWQSGDPPPTKRSHPPPPNPGVATSTLCHTLGCSADPTRMASRSVCASVFCSFHCTVSPRSAQGVCMSEAPSSSGLNSIPLWKPHSASHAVPGPSRGPPLATCPVCWEHGCPDVSSRPCFQLFGADAEKITTGTPGNCAFRSWSVPGGWAASHPTGVLGVWLSTLAHF